MLQLEFKGHGVWIDPLWSTEQIEEHMKDDE